jgi:hypothetical protein
MWKETVAVQPRFSPGIFLKGLSKSAKGRKSRQTVVSLPTAFSTESRPAPGPTHHPVQWVPVTLIKGVRRPRRASDYSPPSTLRMSRPKLPFRPYAFMTQCMLFKHRNDFTCMLLSLPYFLKNNRSIITHSDDVLIARRINWINL